MQLSSACLIGFDVSHWKKFNVTSFLESQVYRAVVKTYMNKCFKSITVSEKHK